VSQRRSGKTEEEEEEEKKWERASASETYRGRGGQRYNPEAQSTK
jgi:hypothetical protein